MAAAHKIHMCASRQEWGAMVAGTQQCHSRPHHYEAKVTLVQDGAKGT